MSLDSIQWLVENPEKRKCLCFITEDVQNICVLSPPQSRHTKGTTKFVLEKTSAQSLAVTYNVSEAKNAQRLT